MNKRLNGITRKAQRGLSLLEIMIGLGIVAIIAIVAVGAATSARGSAQVSAESQNLQLITTKVKSTFAARQNFSGISNAMLIAQRGFPSQMVSGTNVLHSWDGAVTVAPGAGNTSVNVTYAGVPTAACIELVNATARSFNTVTVGSTVVKTATQDNNDVAATTTACGAASAVNIIWNFS